jgi:hypothetical protein
MRFSLEAPKYTSCEIPTSSRYCIQNTFMSCSEQGILEAEISDAYKFQISGHMEIENNSLNRQLLHTH